MPAEHAAIPNRTLFRAPEVCEIANVQPYVLRSWEAEFTDLGIVRSPGTPRVYRRRDVERVMQIKQLVFTEGLTLAGVRKRLGEPRPGIEEEERPALPDLLSQDARERLVRVKDSLRSLLADLDRNGQAPKVAAVAKAAASQPVARETARAPRKTSARRPAKPQRAAKRPAHRKRA